MQQVCILTDSTAQFPSPLFCGSERVEVVSYQVQLRGQKLMHGDGIQADDLPDSAKNGVQPVIIPPSAEDFSRLLLSLERRCTAIVVILASARFCQPFATTFQIAKAAADKLHSSSAIHLIDSQTTSLGLGFLVQCCAQAAQQGASVEEIRRLLNRLIPSIYTVFCTQQPTYLAISGQMDLEQAMVGELLGIAPIILLENGQPVAHKKIQKSAQLVDLFHEFISEFNHLDKLALLQGAPSHYTREIRLLRHRLMAEFPELRLSEHLFSPALAAILGPRSLGMIAIGK